MIVKMKPEYNEWIGEKKTDENGEEYEEKEEVEAKETKLMIEMGK